VTVSEVVLLFSEVCCGGLLRCRRGRLGWGGWGLFGVVFLGVALGRCVSGVGRWCGAGGGGGVGCCVWGGGGVFDQVCLGGGVCG